MIITIAFFTLIISLCIQIIQLFLKAKRIDTVTVSITGASAILLLAGIILRSIQIRFFAITNTYESLVFFSFCITLIPAVFLIFRKRTLPRPVVFGATFTAVLLLALASSPLTPDTAAPPIPALQSHWLVLHVSLAFAGESFFVIAFIASILYLTSKSDEKKRKYDSLTYKATAAGYPIFTAGALIFGAVWASYAWGSFWSWDPKETWALITWLVYTVYLHGRFILKKRKLLLAWISIIGFIFTMFTFFGVNFLLSGLHSYG